MKKAQKVRLGLFILISSVLLIILIGYFTARSMFERQEHYYVAYTNVSVGGLEVGSPVKYMGINVGSIKDISISPEDVSTIIVELALKENTPVKEDAVADIVALGITGMRTIEIRGGTREADFLEPGEYIRPGTSFAEDITGRADDIAFRLEEVLNNLQVFTHPDNMQAFTKTATDLSDFTNQAQQTIVALDEVIGENREDLRRTIAAANAFTDDLHKTSDELFMAVSRFNEIMQGDTLSDLLANFRDISITLKETKLDELIEQLASTTEETQILLRKVGEDIDRGGEVLTDNLLLLEHTLINLHDLSRKASTNPSVLIRRPRMDDAADKILENGR